MKKICLCLLIVMAVLMLTACGAKANRIDVQDITLDVGVSAFLDISVQFEGNPKEKEKLSVLGDLKYASADESIATVSEDGVVTAVSAGETAITVTTSNGITGEAKVSVSVPIEKIETAEKITLILNSETENCYSLDVRVLPADAKVQSMAWRSDNENVAVVDADGQVTAVGQGTCHITAEVNGVEAVTEVNVIVAVAEIQLESEKGTLYVGDSMQLGPIAFPTDAGAVIFAFESDNSDVASVDENGKITANKAGTAHIKISVGDVETVYTVTIKNKVGSNTGNGAVSNGSSGATTGNSGTNNGGNSGGAAPGGDSGSGNSGSNNSGGSSEPADSGFVSIDDDHSDDVSLD